MKYLILITYIIMFLFKTGNVFSDSSIFNVNNIRIDLNTYKNKEIFLNTAFIKGFKQLTDRILLKKDKKKIKNIDIEKIKNFITHYQINENYENNDSQNIIINLAFDKEKLNSFFYQKNILYTDLKFKEVVIFPLVIKKEDLVIYSGNYFYNNWNTEDIDKNKKKQIEYILPVENLENIELIKKYKSNIEDIKTLELFKEYEIDNKLLVVIFDNETDIKVFLKGNISRNKIFKNYKYERSFLARPDFNKEIIKKIKNEILEIIKSNNLIDIRTPAFLNLNLEIKNKNDLYKAQEIIEQIDLIESFNVIELNKRYSKIKIKYFGNINYITEKFLENGIRVSNNNNEWKIEII